jgi:nucleotide-binding universal stress UspA family protein
LFTHTNIILLAGSAKYITVGLKDWFQKKIKQPLTKEEDEITKFSASKADLKKKNSNGMLSEEGKKTSDDGNISEAAKFQTATKEEEVIGLEEEGTIGRQQQQQQQTSSFEEMKTQQQDIELKSIETEQSQSLQSMKEPQQPLSATASSLPWQSHDVIPKYKRILIPHDGSEMSDKALGHAIYLSKVSDADIIILNVLDRIESKDSSAVLATMKGGEGGQLDRANRDVEITMEGGAKQMIEDKMKLCKEAGVKSQVSYKIQTGKPLDEIIKLSEEMDIDLVVMASSRLTSSVRVLGSITRKVIGTVKQPVLVIHK